MVSREKAAQILQTYGSAWIHQDTELLLSLFAPDAVYAERQHEEPYRGHEGIRRYWEEKVVEEQRDISFDLRAVYVDGDTVTGEFSASAFSTLKQQTVYLESVCVFEVHDGLITHWREFWHSRWE